MQTKNIFSTIKKRKENLRKEKKAKKRHITRKTICFEQLPLCSFSFSFSG
jgi:hypothetical protein